MGLDQENTTLGRHVMSTPIAIDINKILQLLPHRYPFLLVDRVIEITPRETITALKNVTMNEPFFQGHFPGFPVMPGVDRKSTRLNSSH